MGNVCQAVPPSCQNCVYNQCPRQKYGKHITLKRVRLDQMGWRSILQMRSGVRESNLIRSDQNQIKEIRSDQY